MIRKLVDEPVVVKRLVLVLLVMMPFEEKSELIVPTVVDEVLSTV